jgi:hypothetical protein
MTGSPELAVRFRDHADAVDNVLISGHALAHSLKSPPSFGALGPDGNWHPAPTADGIARYGLGPLFALWVHCRDLVALRVAWTGSPGPMPAPALPEPDEAPGLSVEAASSEGAANQPRLTGA